MTEQPLVQNVPAAPAAYPGATGAKVLGVIAVCNCWFSIVPVFGWALFVVSLVTGAVALARGRRGAAAVAREPGRYSASSAQRLRTARTTGLVAVIVSALFFVISLLVLAAGDGLGEIANSF